MAIGRWSVRVAALVTLSLVAQILPGVLDMPGGAKPAAADPITPTPPPPAVAPPLSMRVLQTSGPTEAPAEITQDTVWGPQGSPYIVRGLSIRQGVSLTLLPGTVVKVDWLKSILIGGQLLSLGTPNNRVIVTSLRDDSVMGDTNGDGSATVPAPGNWVRVSVTAGNPPFDYPATILDYTDVRYGGYGSGCYAYGMIYTSSPGARLLISNSNITHSQNAGVYIFGERDRGFVGIYNSHFASSCIGVSLTNGGMADVVGNTFDATIANQALYALGPRRSRFWFNTVNAAVGIGGASPPVTRADIDVAYNALSGAIGNFYYFTDWSRNWFGHDANQVLPTCIDPAAAASYYPPITTTASSECPSPQRKVVGYSATMTPALSASPQVLPAFAREAAAPGSGR